MTVEENGLQVAEHSLTKREWFAGQALVGIISRMTKIERDLCINRDDWSFEAGDAYRIADAMIEQENERIDTLQDNIEAARAEIARLREALTWISENYENGMVNHVDFRVEAKHRADDALQGTTA
ncbi:hypothetical protein F1640_18585 [Novosphingobium sp. NBM11]|uniref:hypothetical protein n=1 Tax=Novosphingobium sp. NBM11 TaxID=2596914 RepID=UPI00189284BB|nr:hypothetical protein [Novosphingobium sp. NBM11]MBF5091963.1 hypothetical protein [Novosphingobium sp. NBM11]